MTKRLILPLVALALVVSVLAAPAAQAAPWLSGSEARREIGASLHRKARYGAVTGSLRAECYGTASNRVRCYISFEDWDGDYWCGTASVRETYSGYYIRWNVQLC